MSMNVRLGMGDVLTIVPTWMGATHVPALLATLSTSALASMGLTKPWGVEPYLVMSTM